MERGIKKYVSAERLSQHSRSAPATLVKLCEAGLLEARNIGRRWFIRETNWREKMAGNDIAALVHSLERLRKFRVALTILAGFLFVASVFVLGLELRFPAVALPNLKFSLPTPPSSRLGASLADGVDVFNKYWSERLSVLVHELPDNWSFLQGRVIANWQHFLGVGVVESPPVAPAAASVLARMPASMEPALAQAIEGYIKQQIETQLAGRGQPAQGQAVSPGRPAGGLVAVPSSGDRLRDEEIRARLQEAFSDRVTVKFDSSGTSGVITPIFQGVPASDYLFVLTPLKQR